MKNYWLNKNFWNGFPQDDQYSLQQLAGTSCGNLDFYYAHQYIQKESVRLTEVQRRGEKSWLMGHLDQIPIKGTVVIEFGDRAYWAATEGGHFVNPHDITCVYGEICHESGLLMFPMGGIPREIFVSYEYNMERGDDEKPLA